MSRYISVLISEHQVHRRPHILSPNIMKLHTVAAKEDQGNELKLVQVY